jgi:hypothetical protein
VFFVSPKASLSELVGVTEPFICPALYEKYMNSNNVAVIDEWTLSIAMGVDLAKEMEAHYSSFIVSYSCPAP